MPFEYIRRDLAGYPFNSKYPPNYDLYGSMYHGYKDAIEETFFYDFAVQRYDLKFEFEGKMYYFLCDDEYAALSDEHFTEKYALFKDANTVLEQFEINGRKLIDLIPQIEECEPM